MFKALSRRLYLRIWLAVVAGVVVLMLAVGLAWRASVEHNLQQLPLREWVVRDEQGRVLGSRSGRLPPGQPLEIEVQLDAGEPVRLFLERRVEGVTRQGGLREESPSVSGLQGPGPGRMRPPHLRELTPWWARPPFGFIGLLGLMGLVAALVLYPVVRRFTQRLERLQQGVQRWGEGDLSVRVPEGGADEVADLSRRFNAAAERIERLLAAQKSLLANTSHELRSPLARIRMGLELMEVEGATDAARQRSREEILRNMAELDQMIEEILLASRLDAREAEIGPLEPVDLVGLCAEECARTGASLQVPEGRQTLEVKGVSKLLRRLVRNLLENARRHGQVPGHDPQVKLVLSLSAADVQLRVCDRGPGVPVHLRERIFEPFYRLPGASEGSGGVGLGLALVQSIARRHGGTVRCEDHEGEGACFVVSLPVPHSLGASDAGFV